MSYDSSNIFARILRAEIPCDKIFETNSVLAFRDINAKAPVHILVIPKGEYCNFHDFHENAHPTEIQGFYKAIQEIVQDLKLDEVGYRLITNSGTDGGQEVPHYHVHVLGGTKMGPLMCL